MSYTVFGRAIKNEYLSLGVLVTAFGSAYVATRGGKTSASAKPQTVQQAKDSVPVHVSSSEEEKFVLNFIKEAEKEEGTSGH